jgi:nucleotide-binding universal stress UspA family protein
MTKLLVGYDGSDGAKKALERAAGLLANGEALGVISVAPVVTGGPRSGGPFVPGDGPEEHRAELAEAERYLANRGVESVIIAASGEPGRAICEIAERDGYDTIVVGSRNLSAPKRLMLGSVSTAVAHHAHCDVLIVK